ncbi:hypothetical protein GF312_00420 [Candidatus Poribacteria bacterium]|nr:hypothetical protein [Candidatus Poribacteria bacterium]
MSVLYLSFVTSRERLGILRIEFRDLLGLSGIFSCWLMVAIQLIGKYFLDFKTYLFAADYGWLILVSMGTFIFIRSFIEFGRGLFYRNYEEVDSCIINRYISKFESLVGQKIKNLRVLRRKDDKLIVPAITGTIFRPIMLLPRSMEEEYIGNENIQEKAVRKFTIYHELAHHFNRNLLFLFVNEVFIIFWSVGLIYFLHAYFLFASQFIHDPINEIGRDEFFLVYLIFTWAGYGFLWFFEARKVSRIREIQADNLSWSLLNEDEKNALLASSSDRTTYFEAFLNEMRLSKAVNNISFSVLGGAVGSVIRRLRRIHYPFIRPLTRLDNLLSPHKYTLTTIKRAAFISGASVGLTVGYITYYRPYYMIFFSFIFMIAGIYLATNIYSNRSEERKVSIPRITLYVFVGSIMAGFAYFALLILIFIPLYIYKEPKPDTFTTVKSIASGLWVLRMKFLQYLTASGAMGLICVFAASTFLEMYDGISNTFFKK